MSDLQLGLLVIGIVIVGGVWAYNRYQDAKYRELSDQRFASDHPDALLEPGAAAPRPRAAPAPAEPTAQPAADYRSEDRIEPTLGATAESDAGADAVSPEAEAAFAADEAMAHSAAGEGEHSAARGAGHAATAEAALETASEAAAQRPDEMPVAAPAEAPHAAYAGAVTYAGAAAAPGTEGDPAIDFLVRLSGTADPEQVLDLARELSQGFAKPVWINGWSEADNTWTALTPQLRTAALVLGMQLASRDGPATASDIVRFRDGVLALAEQAGLQGECGDAGAAAGEARALDQFCSEVDIQVVLNLVAGNAPFPGTKIRALAEAAGFALENDGLFHLRNDHGVALYTLSDPAARFETGRMRELNSAAIAFHYDLPRVPGGVRSFDQFCDIARNFANVLGGRLVDDNRSEIGPPALRAIRSQYQGVQSAMEARGFPAGSAVALRLFS